ncbi:MAG: hypothetical protein ACLTEX_13790, partial [Eggerthella lenta]
MKSAIPLFVYDYQTAAFSPEDLDSDVIRNAASSRRALPKNKGARNRRTIDPRVRPAPGYA